MGTPAKNDDEIIENLDFLETIDLIENKEDWSLLKDSSVNDFKRQINSDDEEDSDDK